jgi:hypothetical protein
LALVLDMVGIAAAYVSDVREDAAGEGVRHAHVVAGSDAVDAVAVSLDPFRDHSLEDQFLGTEVEEPHIDPGIAQNSGAEACPQRLVGHHHDGRLPYRL